MTFSHLLFDLDGTLTNPRKGIGNSLKYALQQMHIDTYSDEILEKFVGPPLQDGFKNLFGMNETEVDMAVKHFRTYFGVRGLYENEVYDGVHEMLEELKLAGKKLYLVTSKLEKYARMIVSHFEFDTTMTDLQGAESSGKHSSKGQLIAQLMQRNNLEVNPSIVMIGDTSYDIAGAKENNISGIAVTYGFGTCETLQNCKPDFIVPTVADLKNLLLK